VIEVYAIKVPKTLDKGTFNALLSHATPAKKERILKFVREADRLSSLFADLLIRAIVMKKTGLKNEEISFGKNAYGKPHLNGRDDIHFNLSHSGVWVVAAVDSEPVGIDVEQIQDVDMGISESFFSDDEHHDLLNHHDQRSYFFSLWSLKESYIKIIGKGLSQPLNSFSIRYGREDKIVVTTEGKAREDISFTEYHIHSDYKMFLCASHDRLPEDVTMKSAEELMGAFIG